jgi:tRNA(adenine34) deaminase
MSLALEEARIARKAGEVPVGAVLVVGKKVAAKSHNLVEQLKTATAHAEILAINQASSALSSWHFAQDSYLFVTLEPCPMCAGAIKLARIATVVYAASDPRIGALGSTFDLSESAESGKGLRVISGIKQQEASQILKDFFKDIRK